MHDVIFDGDLTYNKGAWVMHQLRGVIGDSAFFKAMKDWAFSSFRYGSATTEDFASVISTSYGSDLNWFVHQWIYGDGHPDYIVSWQCKRDPAKAGFSLDYFIEQSQTGGTYFKMPIKHHFVTTGGAVDTVLWNEGQGQYYSLHFADSVTNVSVDPLKWILRTVQTVPFSTHVATTSLPTAPLNEPYYQRLAAVGGKAPYYWTFWGGDLPYGLIFQGDTVGVISGTPTYSATFWFTICLTDSNSPQDSIFQDFSLKVEPYIPPYTCGDADHSSAIDISDPVYLITYIFAGGPAPNPLLAGDADCTNDVDISDAVYLINYIFRRWTRTLCRVPLRDACRMKCHVVCGL